MTVTCRPTSLMSRVCHSPGGLPAFTLGSFPLTIRARYRPFTNFGALPENIPGPPFSRQPIQSPDCARLRRGEFPSYRSSVFARITCELHFHTELIEILNELDGGTGIDDQAVYPFKAADLSKSNAPDFAVVGDEDHLRRAVQRS